ncbi:hypothetical protein DPEC_G00144670 [Dallia pectoralis]|uniref:Uncharacterized protein n=1 Tax=Dallia pectoralis TaxID=75939 RepID=A0ACC2GNE8_DALPE|nr:hypothetical protein DPEC_G00144670 [Dallia pectoralis]
MAALTMWLLFFSVVGVRTVPGDINVLLEADMPSLRVQLSHNASINCCYEAIVSEMNVTWMVKTRVNTFLNSTPIESSERYQVTTVNKTERVTCHTLTVSTVRLNDTGFYQCRLSHSSLVKPVFTHGTYLQVYRVMVRTLDISESAKNSILTIEGVLLMLGVLLPGWMMLCKTKKLHELKTRTVNEENIYEGLNLEECGSAYDQVHRTLVQEPYEDVGNLIIPEEEEEEEEEIQLEKP